MKRIVVGACPDFIKRQSPDIELGKYRDGFMRDRDRILYSKPFRRLSRKTQVFLPSSDDHVRTRLTHSLEVAQISITSAQALGLNLDLTEAIALGHDIGHTPFGHTGERVLNLISTNCDRLGGLSPQLSVEQMGFKHNLQGLRVSSDLVDSYDGLTGLNLSNFTMWGVREHTGRKWKKCDFQTSDINHPMCGYPQNLGSCIQFPNRGFLENRFYSAYDRYVKREPEEPTTGNAWSFEAYLVAVTDEIAQRHHDIEDGIIAKVIRPSDIMDLVRQFIYPYFANHEKSLFNRIDTNNTAQLVAALSKLVVGSLNRSLIDNSMENIKHFMRHYNIKKRNDFCKIYASLEENSPVSTPSGSLAIKDIVSYPSSLKIDEGILKGELKTNILNSFQVQRMDGKSRLIIRQLAKAYLSNPQQLPNNAIGQLIRMCFPDSEEIPILSLGDKRSWINEVYFSSSNSKVKTSLLRVICDWISGMTDDYALREHARLYSTSENLDLRHY